jgi:hypothetical protein
MAYIVVSSPPASEESDALDREIESHQGIGRVVALKKGQLYDWKGWFKSCMYFYVLSNPGLPDVF